MSADPRIASAITHWTPRFVANGVLLADFEDVTRSISRWAEWCGAWCERGALHEALGREAMAAGFHLTGAEHLARASAYYHFAKFVFVDDVAQMRAAHMRAVACKRDALPWLTPPGEAVAIPFEGGTLQGYLRTPAGTGRLPLVIMCSGLDSTKEEMEAYEGPYLARGMATLAFDGPGQGEAEYDLPIRGNYETAVSAVVDWAVQRPDVDADRIAVWGVSLGGYYAPRAASHERRLKACVSISGPFDWGEVFDKLPPLTRETFRVRSHLPTLDAARAHAATLTLTNCARNLTCPLFIVAGKEDGIVPWQHAVRMAEAVRGPVESVIVEDGGHNANNRPYRYRSRSADWMAAQLGLPRQ